MREGLRQRAGNTAATGVLAAASQLLSLSGQCLSASVAQRGRLAAGARGSETSMRSDDGVVLLISSGRRAYREYLLTGLADCVPVWLIDEAGTDVAAELT